MRENCDLDDVMVLPLKFHEFCASAIVRQLKLRIDVPAISKNEVEWGK